jgi:ABC-type branched-subunit amino acid transport system ATPase component
LTGNASHSLLEVRGLVKSFGGVHAVIDCTLTVPEGAIVGLIGPNGAGKSTAIDIISGFRTPDSGSIWFDGRQIQGWPAHRVSSHGLMRTFQSPREWPGLSVMENMIASARQNGRDALWRSLLSRRHLAAAEESDREKARALLQQFGLTAVKNDLAGTLSAGQKRLLGFCRIAMASAKLVLLDEPLAGVNPILQEQILDGILLLQKGGVTFLLIEHDLRWIERACELVYVMSLGRTIASGTMQEVRANREVIDAYLGDATASV